MKGLINIKNNDNKCFLWCHVRHLNPVERNPQRITIKDRQLVNKLSYERINFPVSRKDYCKVEIKNNICINVFCYDNNLTYPVYLSNQKFNDNMDLLLISNELKSHYVYIKNFDKFMFNKIKNRNKKYFCKFCLQFFGNEKVSTEHRKDCLVINGKQKHFNKNLIMSAEEEERFEQSNISWNCNKLFDVSDNKVRDHCHVTGKFRGAAHWSCNVNFKLSKKVPLIFYNLKGYDSHLIFKELSKFNAKISVIPNGLEKYMAFTVNRNLVFIDSMQFMNSSLDSLVKNLMSEDFKCLSEEFSGELLRLVKEKGVYPYEYMDSFKKFNEDKLPDKKFIKR